MQQRINILDRVKSSLLESGLRGPLILAYSGGLDSSALLHLLNQCDLQLIVAHCNFQLRGDESDRDEEFCRQRAEQYGLKFHSKSFDTLGYAADRGISVQMAARDLRYDFFKALKDERKAGGIAVASHLDDQLETFMIKLGRGAGPGGLKGMDVWDGQIFRPLLKLSREELEAYVSENDISFVEDSSNTTDDYERNALRHKVVPVWKSQTGHLLKSFEKSRQRLARMEEFSRGEAIRFLEEHLKNDRQLSIAQLLDHASPDLILFYWLHPLGFNESQLEAVESNLMSTESKVFLTNSHQFIVERDQLVLEDLRSDQSQEFKVNLAEGLILLSGNQIRLSLEPTPQRFEPHSIYMDRAALGDELLFRRWREGDRFTPLGMTGSKKISDLFTDHKVPQSQKDSIWLVESRGEIQWVVGIQQSDSSKVSGTTKQVLRLEILG